MSTSYLEHVLSQVSVLVHICPEGVWSVDGGGSLVSLDLVLLPSRNVVGVNITESGNNDMGLWVRWTRHFLDLGLDRIPQPPARHGRELSRNSSNEEITHT